MAAQPSALVRSRIEKLVGLARVLEHVEHTPAPFSAARYQALVGELKAALADDIPTQALDIVLATYPATAELYENLHYERSGLSRSPLDRSIATEMQAAQVLAGLRLRHG